MALTDKQTQELNIASQRLSAGNTYGGYTTDKANVDYATKNFGYTYKPPTQTPTGMTQITSPEQATQFNVQGQVGTGAGSYLYGTPKTAVADQIGEQKELDIITRKPDTTLAESTVAGSTEITNGIEKQIQEATKPLTSEEILAKSLQDETLKLLGQTRGKATALGEEEKKRNVEGLSTQLAQKNADILAKTAEYNQLKKSYEATIAENRNRPIPMSSIIGREAAIQRAEATALNQKAADIQLDQALALGLQGQVEAAQSAAQRAVDLKYAAVEEELNIKQEQLKLLQPTLTKQENARATILQRKYEQEKQNIADKKAEQTSLYNLMIQTPKAGILPTDTLAQAAQKASTYLASQPTSAKWTVTGSYFDENGVQHNTYGFVDEAKGTVIPYSPTGTQGNVNFGLPTGNISGLTAYNTEGNNPGISRAVRNNNPGNIKVSDFTKGFGGVIGVDSKPASDGGNFLVFDTPENGIKAVEKLLKEGKSYKGVSAEKAIKTWNGNGSYGATDVGLDPSKDFQSQISDPSKLRQVALSLAQNEDSAFSLANQPTQTTAVSATVQSWVDRIVAGDAVLTDVKNDVLKNQVVKELSRIRYKKVSDLAVTALESAKELKEKFDNGEGISVVGGSRMLLINPFTGKAYPGTPGADFETIFDNLKASLSLDSVKYLKGQGAVSDAERALLAASSSKIALGQSDEEFGKSLEAIIKKLEEATSLGQPSQTTTNTTGGTYTVEYPVGSGKLYTVDSNGNMTPQ